ncbi:MAG: helix-turn-helix domain-containing protein [Blautia wexlerae]
MGQSSLSKLLKGEMKLTLQHIFKICAALKLPLKI